MCNLDVVPRRDTALSGYATTLLDPLRRHIVRRSTLAMPPRPASTAPAALALLALLSAALGVDGLGINLGNVLEAPTEGAWAPVAQEYYFDDYASRGFTFVRGPVRWDEHMGKSPPYVIDATFLARVHEVTGWALTRNLSVLINSHHDDWIDVADDGAFQAALPRFQALWTQVAASFASAPTSLFFEVCNEFHLISLANANAVYASVVPIMRAAGGLSPTDRATRTCGSRCIRTTPTIFAWRILPPTKRGAWVHCTFARLAVPSAPISHRHPAPSADARGHRGRACHLHERNGVVRFALRPLHSHGRGRLPDRRTLTRWPPALVRHRCLRRQVELQRVRSAAEHLGRLRDVEDLRPRKPHVGRGRDVCAGPVNRLRAARRQG